MKPEAFARTLLFGTTLEEKLLEAPLLDGGDDLTFASRSIEMPAFPGRPPALTRIGKAEFPALQQLHRAEARGEVLHFFANHELLAMELMALMLLRFPEAPEAFRAGILRTIQEEQSHLRLYLSRMRELGVEFGDLPLSDYFWNVMKKMRSPLEFVVQMSLTLEQANLDFSRFFMNAIRETGDEPTALILERVLREEIGHVKHGLTWFNRWRESSTGESEWDAYRRLLPPPMTPRRAKGIGFCADARREAGLSDAFIRELRLCSGSKGRPPVLWRYNPHCDAEIARGRKGFTPREGARRLSRDLGAIPVFLARPEDALIMEERPRSVWLEALLDAGFELPEIIEAPPGGMPREILTPKLGGLQPWGWSPDIFNAFKPLRERLVRVDGGNTDWCGPLLDRPSFAETGLGRIFSKGWSAAFLREWMETHPETEPWFGGATTVGVELADWKNSDIRIRELLSRGGIAMVKAPYGTAGMQVREVRKIEELVSPHAGPLSGWIRNVLARQGSVIVEPLLNRTADLSIQLEVEDERVRLLEVRRFLTDRRHSYRGTCLGARHPGLSSDERRFLHAALPSWRRLLRDLGTRLRNAGYRGPAGVDALLWKDHAGFLKLKPLVELNPRWTMGRVALELEKHLVPGVSGLWMFVPLREINARGFATAASYAQELKERYPLRLARLGGEARIESGVVFTNDPETATEVLTVLATLPNSDLDPPQLAE